MKTKHVTAILLILLLVSVGLNVRQAVRLHKVAASASAQGTKQLWTCPMDPQIVQDHPGKCPICGMNLVLQTSASNEEAKTSSQAAEKEPEKKEAQKYQCPMHPSIVQDHPGDCPICGMKLVKMQRAPSNQGGSNVNAPRKIAFYRSPMDPKQTWPTPRKDEMGMDYVPVYEEEVSGGGGGVEGRATVTIDPTSQQLIGLRTAPVSRGHISTEWRTVGRVQVDPTKVSKINVKTSGYVERVFVDFVGRPVSRGEPLFTSYSPELLTAQREYLLALKAKTLSKSGAQSERDSVMVSAARQKLRLWDVPEAEIERLEQTGEVVKALTFVSPLTGVVTAKNVVEGSSLNPGDAPYEITDLSSVWVMADAYQSDVARAKVGMSAAVSLESLPGHVFQGKVAFIDPLLDPQSRTFKVRINVDNVGGELKPDMFAEVLFQGAAHEALTVPVDAVIPSGRGNMVFVAIGDGRFQPRAVRLGEKSGDRVEVVEGLGEGESVVTRANFLVDSESSLRAALAAVGGSP
jgi:Cu(I)/Ag(I) efflux system membrane fusion protein